MESKVIKKFVKKAIQKIKRNKRISIDILPEIKKAISKDPLHPHLHYKLGLEYYNRHSFFVSAAQFRTAFTLKSCFPEAEYWLGRSYFNIGVFDLAIARFVNVIQNNMSSDRLKLKSFENLIMCFEEDTFRNIRERDLTLESIKNNIGCIIEKTKSENHKLDNLWKTEYLGYGKYQRNRMVAERINTLRDKNLSVIDIGGGEGSLCLFIPHHNYVLADSSMNGINGLDLPFADKLFDIAISCDTLEHIPKGKRELFVSEMIRVARRRAYVVAPFGEATRHLEKFFYELTHNPWTKEHLEHDFTTLDEMSAFLEKRHLKYKVSPCSFLPAHFAMGYLNISFLSNNPELFKKVNEFFNTYYAKMCRVEPSCGYLIEIVLS